MAAGMASTPPRHPRPPLEASFSVKREGAHRQGRLGRSPATEVKEGQEKMKQRKEGRKGREGVS